ncbi:O-methylsterigmatocystin oxidoreductase [Podospora australis]|uniref:O-methylsterigmatocystin oxidoreductase n=1 Tax=Podospora australis TaxID=1536484 RepID=A0AAN7ACT8_9PEZI|nr:O-methylsterigmatocystin oxidoreductase [Podospora australis]
MASSSWFLTAIMASVAFVVFKLRNVGRRPKDYPPGPPTLPIIGNLHLMLAKNAHVQFKKWAEEYGPVYSLILGTTTTIVLSSDVAIKDLLDKRSNIYSSRPDMYISGLASGNMRMLLMEYGDTWRKIRKLFHTLLQLKTAKSYVPYQDLESASMMIALLEQPDLVFDHIRRFTNSLSTQIIYGFRVARIDDPKLLRLYQSVEGWAEVTGAAAAAVLDVFPILRSLPAALTPLYHHALKLQEFTSSLNTGLYLDAKKLVDTGKSKPSFCVGLVQAQHTEGFSNDLAAAVAGTALEASSDTTASTLAGLVQALVLYPEAQKRGQEVIDQVCGDRFPDINDMENPKAQYIRAMAKESLRWLPTAILGVPHSCIKDNEYMGYKIPKGASVVYNVWAVHMDPRRHPDPRAFKPERYMYDFASSTDSAQNPDATKRDHFTFGAGRRVCQGMHVVDRGMFLVITRLMWAFEFSRGKDGEGKEVMPDQDDLVGGFLVQPRPFPVTIKPRSEERAKKVREAWEKCRALLDEDEQWREVPEGMPFTRFEPGGKGEFQ